MHIRFGVDIINLKISSSNFMLPNEDFGRHNIGLGVSFRGTSKRYNKSVYFDFAVFALDSVSLNS